MDKKNSHVAQTNTSREWRRDGDSLLLISVQFGSFMIFVGMRWRHQALLYRIFYRGLSIGFLFLLSLGALAACSLVALMWTAWTMWWGFTIIQLILLNLWRAPFIYSSLGEEFVTIWPASYVWMLQTTVYRTVDLWKNQH